MASSAFTVTQKDYAPKKGDYVVLPYLNATTPAFDSALFPRGFRKLAPSKTKGETRLAQLVLDADKEQAVAVCRLDKPGVDVARQAKMMVSTALQEAKKLGLKRVITSVDESHEALALAIQEGAVLGGYVFDKYMSKKKKPLSVSLVTSIARKQLAGGKIIADCVNFARDTLNGPPAEIHPVSLAAAYVEFGTAHGLQMTIWDEKKLAKENCGGILAVGQGSKHKPRLVCGTYCPADATTHLALVGKGVTFDSGGYSLKPSKSMTEMKFDMGGAAMMFGAACAVAALELPIQVSVYLPLAHNAISSDAYNVSDVVTTRSGLTVEVLNTDAEGRIILADALAIACEQGPDYLIDSATLTGAAVVALGEDIAAVYGDERRFVSQVLDAAQKAGEDMWPMPLHAAYDTLIDSKIADVKNIGGAWGGSITAALFLKRFVKKVPNWIHIDIAGPGCKLDALEHLDHGAKGFGVKTIVAFAKTLCDEDVPF